MQPSFSGLFVICAYLPNTTFPPAVTIPSSDTLTSMTVPLVKTPSCVYIGDWGFFLTPRIWSWNVALRSAVPSSIKRHWTGEIGKRTMCHIRFLVAQSHGSHESLHFDRFTGKALTDESSLCDHALPRFFLALPGTHDLEHLVFCDTPNFGQRYGIFCGFVLSLLLDGGGQCLGVLLTLSVKQKGR